MIKEFTKYGYSYSHNNNIGSGYNASGIAVTSDATNSPGAVAFPDDCYIDSIELEASGLASNEIINIFLARDSAGAVPITTATLEGSSQLPTIRTGTVGGYSFGVGKDYHFDASVTNTTRGTIYFFAKVLSGGDTAVTVNVRINWRA